MIALKGYIWLYSWLQTRNPMSNYRQKWNAHIHGETSSLLLWNLETIFPVLISFLVSLPEGFFHIKVCLLFQGFSKIMFCGSCAVKGNSKEVSWDCWSCSQEVLKRRSYKSGSSHWRSHRCHEHTRWFYGTCSPLSLLPLQCGDNNTCLSYTGFVNKNGTSNTEGSL